MEWSTNVENPVLHVIVVGFHHKKGCQVEYSYPPLIDGKTVDSNECPDEWKHLPSLALPDGAHNFTEDTVFFHLPSRTDPKLTVFGVSCYRQINSVDLLNRGTDVTRNTVQKSVCVLSRLPVFGLIQAKLELITHAYFKGRDFSQVTLLEETYKTLNLSLTDSLLHDSQVFLGLSCRDLLHHFQHRMLILFKLMLLERRVLFFSSPVKPICTSLLTLISLFPGMIEHGLSESGCYSSRRSGSRALQVDECDDYLKINYKHENDSSSGSLPQTDDNCELLLSSEKSVSRQEAISHYVLKQNDNISQSTFYVDINTDESLTLEGENVSMKFGDSLTYDSKLVTLQTSGIFGSCRQRMSPCAEGEEATSDLTKDTEESFPMVEGNLEELLDKDDELNWETDKLLLEINEALDDDSCHGPGIFQGLSVSTVHHNVADAYFESTGTSKYELTTFTVTPNSALCNEALSRESLKEKRFNFGFQNNSFEEKRPEEEKLESPNNSTSTTAALPFQKSEEKNLESSNDSTLTTGALPFQVDEFGFPLSIFTKGILFHPYLSLHLYDLLSDINVRGFVVGATNALFKQKAHLTDVIVELSDVKIEIHDNELKKQLTLTMADMRFAEHLIRSMGNEKGDIYLDDTAWSEWEGGDDWLRSQFRTYLLSLLATVCDGDDKMVEDFNSSFAAAWKTTHNYKQWKSCRHPGMAGVPAEHPFHGQLSMSDVRLRINQVIQQADRNKKINAVVSQTGKVVTQTGKVVGDAISSAKSVMTTWFGSISGSKT